MIKLIRLHRMDERDLVEMFLQVGQSIGNPQPGLHLAMKRIHRPHQLGCSGDESEPLPSKEFLRTILPIEFGQFRFVLEQFQLARRAGHVKINHPLGLGRKMRRQCAKRMLGVPRRGKRLQSESAKPHRTHPGGALPEKMAARQLMQRFQFKMTAGGVHLVKALSRLRIALATKVRAESDGVPASFWASSGSFSYRVKAV